MKENGYAHFFSPENVGPYLLRNSLAAITSWDALAIFDADDIMMPKYLASLLPLVQDGIAGGARQTITKNGVAKDKGLPFRHGVCVISRQAWLELGGFRPWRILGDWDFIYRAKAKKIPITSYDDKPVYRRREHPNSITSSPTTGRRTPIRKQYKIDSRRYIKNGDLYVPLVTVPLIWRTP